MMNTAEQILDSTPIFSGLNKPERELVTRFSDIVSLKEGELLFEQDSSGEELFIVHNGEILITRANSDGKDIDIARMIGGDLFGEIEFFQGSRRNFAARAITDTVLLQFPREGINFQDLILQQPSISAFLLNQFLKVVAGRIRKTNKLVADNSPIVQELKKQVYGDKLTGLYNRTYLEEQFHTYLKEPRQHVALLMVKPDNFKLINDTYGHEAGDSILRLLASLYSGTITEKDTLVRYMGNEFGFVLSGMEREEAKKFGEHLQDLVYHLDLSDFIDDTSIHLTLSMGIALFPGHGEQAEELIEAAHSLPLIGRAMGGGKILFPDDKQDI